jgi:soluble lytic murein transglycosylase-like protein
VTKRRLAAVSLAAVLLLALIAIVLSVVAARQRVARHRLFHPAPPESSARPAAAAPKPVDQWSAQFRALEQGGRWKDLTALLDEIERSHAELHAKSSLGYLQARALIEENDPKDAAARLAPFLAPGHPLRDLALFHQAEIDDARGDHAGASARRQELIFGYAASPYRELAIDDETELLARRGDLKAFAAFAARLFPAASTERRRDQTARLVELSLRAGDASGALARGLALLRAGTTDDAADRVSRALDRPDLVRRMNGEALELMGTALQNHRHFDRAVAFLTLALRALPQKRDELTFDLGRSWFGDEKYAQAAQTYFLGAAATADPKWKATFLFHASRAVQLQGDDAGAEKLMTAAIAVPGRFPATTAALTQRIRTRLKQKRYAEAAGDLAFLRKNWPKDHALAEGSLAYAIGMLGAGNRGAALSALNAIPRALLDKFEVPEAGYWRARALEASNPPASFAAYLGVLRAPVPTHFAYFARERLDSADMQPKLSRELATREAEVARLVAAGNWDLARHVQTDRVLLSTRDFAAQLRRLAEIYDHLPPYAAVLHLAPAPMPRFPLPEGADRASLLMAMGLFDEAADEIPRKYPLRPLRSGLTQSLALNLGNASRESIYAIEVLMNGIPGDYVPQLLPRVVRELLYPRYFYDFISADAKRYGADPTLVLAIMREESRFNPRAKSEAAARGLLQFIITTAREIGRDAGLVDVQPEDLYDPRVIIRLGAKYIAELSARFGGNRCEVAGSYNAGANQVALWVRLAPAPGDDFFLSSINFDETKNYVRKVMNSYKRYVEIYGNGVPTGGVRAEP